MRAPYLLLVLMLVLPALAESNDAKICEGRGGKYRSGPVGGMICEIPYPDGGRNCSDDSQCKGGCIIELGSGGVEPKKGDRVKGICQRTDFQTGCNVHVERGRMQESLCIN